MSRNKKNCFLRQKILFTTEFLQPRCQGSGKYPAISQLAFVYPTTSTKDMIRTLLVFKIERFEILFLLVAVMGKHPFWVDFRDFRDALSHRLREFFRNPWWWIVFGSCIACRHKEQCDVPTYTGGLGIQSQ